LAVVQRKTRPGQFHDAALSSLRRISARHAAASASTSSLLSIEEYQRLTGGPGSIIDLLAMPTVEDIEFEAPRAQGLSRPADLS